MTRTYNIKGDDSITSTVRINSKDAHELGVNNKRRAHVCFGSRRYFVDLDVSNLQSEGIIALSSDLKEALHMPDFVDYEMFAEGNRIVFGPYIGIAAAQSSRGISRNGLRRMLFYARYYSMLHGAIVIFSLDAVKKDAELIEGYCYNPRKNNWEKGLFPYPAAIYRRTFFNREWQNYFLEKIGDRVFNYHFNKWDMYRWFSRDGQLNQYIPDTIVYHSYKDVMHMLEKYGRIYVKPLSKAKGRGVVQISADKGSIIFAHREGGKNYKNVLRKRKDIINYIERIFRTDRYLIQQAVDLLVYRGRIIDFRCVMQKDQTETWMNKGIIGRYGAAGSVVSNICAGGSALWADELLKKVYGRSRVDWRSMLKDMEALAYNVCGALDKYGVTTGSLGLDIGIDRTGRLWIIEINNKFPEPLIALDVKDRDLYDELRITPLFYAKALAGFKKVENRG